MDHKIPSQKKSNVAFSFIRLSSPSQMKGDSLRHQTEASKEYTQEHSLYINHSLHLQDLGISTFRSKNAPEGKLARFLSAVQTGHVPTLSEESPDRLSQEQAAEALTQFLQIIRADSVVIISPLDEKYKQSTEEESQ